MRPKYNFILPKKNRKIYKLNTSFQAIKSSNNLSNNTKLSPTLSHFERVIKINIIGGYDP